MQRQRGLRDQWSLEGMCSGTRALGEVWGPGVGRSCRSTRKNPKTGRGSPPSACANLLLHPPQARLWTQWCRSSARPCCWSWGPTAVTRPYGWPACCHPVPACSRSSSIPTTLPSLSRCWISQACRTRCSTFPDDRCRHCGSSGREGGQAQGMPHVVQGHMYRVVARPTTAWARFHTAL